LLAGISRLMGHKTENNLLVFATRMMRIHAGLSSLRVRFFHAGFYRIRKLSRPLRDNLVRKRNVHQLQRTIQDEISQKALCVARFQVLSRDSPPHQIRG
jgi:hypothetical protein